MAEISRLPGPVMDLWEWQFEGACRDADQDLFFHPEGERGSARRRRAEAAKAICATCPVLKECREQSLAVREPYGVWGGLSEDERAALLGRSPETPHSESVSERRTGAGTEARSTGRPGRDAGRLRDGGRGASTEL